jgi:hypothetical protein
MKLKTILLTLLCATVLNLSAHAQEYTFLIVDGTAHPAESGTTYQAPAVVPGALNVGNEGGSYTGTNITLTNTFAFQSTPPPSGAYVFNQGQLSLTDSTITAAIAGVTLIQAGSGTLNNVTINAGQTGVLALNSTLNLTGGKITTTMSDVVNVANFSGISLQNASNGTLNDVDIEAALHGVWVQQSTLELIGGNITLSSFGSMGITIGYNSNATVSGVNIYSETLSAGVVAEVSTLTLADSTITTGDVGVIIQVGSSGTLNNVNITITKSYDEYEYYLGYGVVVASSTLTLTGGNINTSGTAAHGIFFVGSSGTITDVNITTTGEDARALHLTTNSTATANLNNKTLTGGITAEASSTLTLTGSNGTHLNGDITTTDHSTVNLTLTGADTQLNGNLTQDDTSAINLTLDTGAMLTGGGELNSLTLTNGVTITHTANLITVTESIIITDTVTFDLSDLTTTGDYDLIDWIGATTINLTGATYTHTGPGIQGTFNTDGTKLTFTATAIPEPSTYILIGIGIALLLITTRRRKVQS